MADSADTEVMTTQADFDTMTAAQIRDLLAEAGIDVNDSHTWEFIAQGRQETVTIKGRGYRYSRFPGSLYVDGERHFSSAWL